MTFDENKERMEVEASRNKQVRLTAIKSFVQYQQAQQNSSRRENASAKQSSDTKPHNDSD